jgi:hypothetical protein
MSACPVECEAYSSGVVNPPEFGGGSSSLTLNKIELFSKVSTSLNGLRYSDQVDLLGMQIFIGQV